MNQTPADTMRAATAHTPITLLICALGGEGGGVLCDWLIAVAHRAGYPAQGTSIPGVAQRTGATTYYIEVYPMRQAELGAARPVFSLSPVPGALDALVSSELLETARQITNGMVDPRRTSVITSSSRALTTQERMVLGDGRYPEARLLEIVREFSREHHVFDMAQVTREAATVVSAVLLGAIAASGVLPFERADYEAVIGSQGKAAQASLQGFTRAWDIVTRARQQQSFVAQVLGGDAPAPVSAPPLPATVAAAFPAAVHEMLTLGHARLIDYQDQAYADLYVERLTKVLAAERAADPAGARGWQITREMARWLALWMAFDDIVRVATLKARATRTERVRREVKAGSGELVRVFDHFKPGVPEFAALLPAVLAGRLVRWDRRRQQAGREPWAMKLVVGTHTVFGIAALRLLGSLRWLRRRGQRFAQEQALIDRWLAAVLQAGGRHWRLGHELALCGRLIKGYGSTNERGKDNLLHIIEHLATGAAFESDEARAEAIARAREAALADDAGTALDQQLARDGAAARPLREQPIRWVRRRPADVVTR